MGVQIPGWIVPQQAYSAGSADFRPRPPIRFFENGAMGIRLQRALEQDFRAMPDATQFAVLNETGTKIAMRIMVRELTRIIFVELGPLIERGLCAVAWLSGVVSTHSRLRPHQRTEPDNEIETCT